MNSKSSKETEHLGSVRDFFDGHAFDYERKYKDGNSFYSYFFFERLEKATHGINFAEKRVLDIGAGTGPLYDYLNQEGKSNFSSYEATDISGGMLDQSSIPENDRYVGDFLEIELSGNYDLIFMLGVSTYLTPENMRLHVEKVNKLLKKGGLFIVTFTNNSGLDTRMRKLFTPLMKFFAGKDRIISQSFLTTFYSEKDADLLFPDQLMKRSASGLNHTIFPVSRIAQGLSITIAKRVSKLEEGKMKNFLSSDLLFIVEKK